jgi:small subunit ribosomal protein S18
MADETKPTESAAVPAAASTTSTPSERPQSSYPRREGGYRSREGGGSSSGPRREGSSGPRREGGSNGPGGASGGRDPRKFFRRKKVCKFCTDKIDTINYKDVRMLQQFVAPEGGKITPRRITGVCSPHQRRVTEAIKQARNIALLPFAGR